MIRKSPGMIRRPQTTTNARSRVTLGHYGESDVEENCFLRNLLKQQSAERERLRDFVERSPFRTRRQKQLRVAATSTATATTTTTALTASSTTTGLDFARSRSCTDLNKARKSQHQTDFNSGRRPSYSQREPQIRKIGKDLNQMAISLDTGKRSELLHRRQQNRTSTGPNRHVSAEHNPRNTSRRSSEATRNRSLVRQAQANDRLQSSNYSRNQDKHKIVETTMSRKHRRDKKSVKSTEGSSKKSTKENETAVDETEDYGMDETDELYRRITSWVDTVNKHIEADDFDKCVIMENIDYSDDIERPDTDYYDHQSPGNHHHVEIVLYNGD